MPAWLKTHPARRAELELLSFEAEAVWHIVRLYCAAVGNDGRLPKADLHIALARKISEAKARRIALDLVARGHWVDHGDTFELAGWLDEQPEADTWSDDTKRERWARGKALLRNRDLCRQIQERDLNLCRYCAVRVNWTDRKGPAGGTYDHVDPDGPNTLGNVVVCCRKCNGRKRDRTPEQANMVLRPVPVPRSDIWPESSPNQNPVRPESDRRPDSLACARETGPGQIGIRSAARFGSDRSTPPEALDEAGVDELLAEFGGEWVDPSEVAR